MKIIRATALAALFALGAISAAFADVSGTFKGASNHVTKGGVTVTQNNDGTATVTFASNFSLDGAPDPRVGFGKNGRYASGSDLGKLKKLNGAQSYVVPATLDIDGFNEIYVWCRKFSVPLGVAALK